MVTLTSRCVCCSYILLLGWLWRPWTLSLFLATKNRRNFGMPKIADLRSRVGSRLPRSLGPFLGFEQDLDGDENVRQNYLGNFTKQTIIMTFQSWCLVLKSCWWEGASRFQGSEFPMKLYRQLIDFARTSWHKVSDQCWLLWLLLSPLYSRVPKVFVKHKKWPQNSIQYHNCHKINFIKKDIELYI